MASPLASPAPAEPDPTPVRLDVRVGSGRPASYQMAGGEFGIGGAEGCDVRLPGTHLPPLVCQIARTPDGLRLRKLDPAFPVLLNGAPVAAGTPVPVGNGDRIAVGPADVTVSLATGHLRPRFVPIDAPPPPDSQSNPSPPSVDAAPAVLPFTGGASPDIAAEREELIRLSTRLEEQARELEADRVLWYGRRQEIEAESERVREQTATLAEREAELTRAREELAAIRQQLHDQYTERREQLTQMQEVVRGATEALNDRQRQLEERDNQQLAEAQAEIARLREELARRDAEVRTEHDQHADDVVRLDRWQASLNERQRDLDRRAAEVDERFEQLRRDTSELEEQVRLADAEQGRINAEGARLDKVRAELEAQRGRLAERAAQLEAQQAKLAVLRAGLDRQHDDARQANERLAADRVRLDDAQRELDTRLHEAERLRAELTSAREDQAEQEQLAAERAALLDATLAEIQQQKDALTAEQARLNEKEAELDTRAAEIAEQTATLKARVTQVMELRERLEADRAAVRERELTLTDADYARQTFQEQLRRRSDELSARMRELDETARRLADDRAALEQTTHATTATQQEFAARAAALEQRARELDEREATFARQMEQLREAGRTVATARKDLADARGQWDAEREAFEAYRSRAASEIESLRRDAPDLEGRARATLERLTAARDVLRGHLGELHTFASQTREELDAQRAELRAEADRLREREQAMEKARGEHRLAVTDFRQQLLDWQAKIADLKLTLSRGETRLDARQAETDAITLELARQAEELRHERQRVAERRGEVERHLSDMREWYRKKLRELAVSRGGDEATLLPLPATPDDLDAGDKQLGELLQSLELVDPDTLGELWAEARRQRRTLRQVLLASGTVTLYQLALIEAGSLDGLMLGRLRVVDRLRVTAREAVYRVFDPTRADGPSRGLFLLRHLSESEMDDAVRPDEFRQRFAAARGAAHPNLAATVEVLEINGRPAALQEWLVGLPSADWPADVATPGLWVKLLADAAAALEAAHRGGLAHGRLASDSFLLSAEGVLKLTGLGEPPWLAGGSIPSFEPTPEADLRALGQTAFGWTQLGQPAGRRRGRAKAFPESLMAVVRRLEADAETPMADTAPGATPYRSAADLVADLARLAALFPCPPDTWDSLVRQAADYRAEGEPPLRQSA
jgi:chromosome segregation ATPase